MKFKRVSGALAVVFLSAALLTACEDDKSVEEARDDLCDDLAVFHTATEGLAAIDSSSTVGELRDAQEDVASAWDDVQSSAADVDDAEIGELEAAYDQLQETVDGIDDDAVILEAVANVEADLAAVDAAWQEVVTVTPCNAAEATETPEGTATEEAEEATEATEEADTATPEAEETAEPTTGGPTEAPATSEPTTAAEATATP